MRSCSDSFGSGADLVDLCLHPSHSASRSTSSTIASRIPGQAATEQRVFAPGRLTVARKAEVAVSGGVVKAGRSINNEAQFSLGRSKSDQPMTRYKP